MSEIMKSFWEEEDGMGTVEVVLILAALVCVALIFRKTLVGFVEGATEKIFQGAEAGTDTGSGTP